MARRSQTLSPVANAALWPLGVGLTSWRYMWRTTPLHRRQLAGSLEKDSPPELPPAVSLDDVRRPEDGVGALFHRRYAARIHDSGWQPEELMVARLCGGRLVGGIDVETRSFEPPAYEKRTVVDALRDKP